MQFDRFGERGDREITDVLVRFYIGNDDFPSGVDKNGMPVYQVVLRVNKSKPPLLGVDRPATDDDIAESPEAYRMYQNEQKGREMEGTTGYPIAMWMVPTQSEVSECWKNGIFTVEQLAKHQTAKMPPAIVELAKRARKMIELTAKQGRFEAIISNLEATVAAQNEQINELRTANEGMKVRLDILAARGIAA